MLPENYITNIHSYHNFIRICDKIILTIILGFIFTLPKRQIAAEVLYSYKLETMDGNVKMICTIWFDKKQDQNQKLLFSIDKEYKISEDRNNFVIRSTANLQIPTLPKVRINV